MIGEPCTECGVEHIDDCYEAAAHDEALRMAEMVADR